MPTNVTVTPHPKCALTFVSAFKNTINITNLRWSSNFTVVNDPNNAYNSIYTAGLMLTVYWANATI
jgi:hypothetical protein